MDRALCEPDLFGQCERAISEIRKHNSEETIAR
jgi:hypothetical protein